MPSADPVKRRFHARQAALVRASRYDGREVTRAARAKFQGEHFLDQVDPDGRLRIEDPAEAERRAVAAYRLHFVRMAERSRQSKRRAKGLAV